MKSVPDGKGDLHFREAYRLFKKKRYRDSVPILQNITDRRGEDPLVQFFLILSLLYSENYSLLNTAMKRMDTIYPEYPPYIQFKLFMGLKSSRSRDDAINLYLNSIEKNHHKRKLKKSLRKIEDATDFSEFQKNARLNDFVKIPGIKIAWIHMVPAVLTGNKVSQYQGKALPYYRRPVIILLFFIFILIFSFMITWYFVRFSSDSSRTVTIGKEKAEKIDMIILGGSGYGLLNRISFQKAPEFYVSPDALINDFNEAKQLIKSGRFNDGIIILNRIINSNAGSPVRERCEFLIRFVIESTGKLYSDIDMDKFNEKPYLFRGTSVRATGKVSNLVPADNGISFLLMVESGNGRFKGLCRVFHPVKEKVTDGDSVEVKGTFFPGIGSKETMYISSESISLLMKTGY